LELTWSAGGWEETGTGGAGNQGGMREDTLKAGGRRERRSQEQEGAWIEPEAGDWRQGAQTDPWRDGRGGRGEEEEGARFVAVALYIVVPTYNGKEGVHRRVEQEAEAGGRRKGR
jgi:hypothetical protein